MLRSPKLALETLEDKCLLSYVFGINAPIWMNSSGIVQINGSGGRDAARVWIEDSQVHMRVQFLDVTIGDKEAQRVYPIDLVKGIRFNGGSGNDSYTNDTSIMSNANGGPGNDTLIGGSGNDGLVGGEGDDAFEGRGGDDVLRGDKGSDVYEFRSLAGGLGSDIVIEGSVVGTDTLYFRGMDAAINVDLRSTEVRNVAYGQLRLRLTSSAGIENVTGSDFSDIIQCNDRDNVVFAKDGDDIVFGAGGNDRLSGDDDDDFLTGNDGDDVLSGGHGNDTAYGYGGNDQLWGSDGNDDLRGGTGANTISDGDGNDRVDFSQNSVAIHYITGGGNDTVFGTSRGDSIHGSNGNDALHGGGGNDRLFGEGGADWLFGDSGNDWLEAGSAAEVADGGSGFDYNAHKWAVDGATYDDVKQGQAGTCVFLSGLSGAAKQGIPLASRISYLGDYNYRVRLFNADSELMHDEIVHFDGSIIKDADGKRFDPWSADEGEFWTILYQRAYLRMMDYLDEDFTDPEYAMYAVTGREVETDDWDDPNVLKSALAAGKVVTAGQADQTDVVFDHHSYTVLGVGLVDGEWWIKLRNPWGIDGGTVMWGQDDGIIYMRWSTFQGYSDFDRISIS